LPVYPLHINRSTQHEVFSDWLLSLSTLAPRFIWAVVWIGTASTGRFWFLSLQCPG
jgi:hypothetical protein